MTQVFLIVGSTSPYTSPPDWDNSTNTIEVVAGGGAGGQARGAGTRTGLGGGGGEYGKTTNFSFAVPGTTTAVFGVGAGGISNVTDNSAGATGGSTWFNGASQAASTIGAIGGTGGSFSASSGANTGAAGGTGGVGTTHFAGGAGGSTGASAAAYTGTGGGGAGGPNGAGNAGVQGNTVGGIATNGGSGDNGSGGAAGVAAGATGGAGGNGTEWDASHGSGGGGAGANSSGGSATAGAGGSYGAGGGGAGAKNAVTTAGAGGNGLIILTYTPFVAPTNQPETYFIAKHRPIRQNVGINLYFWSADIQDGPIGLQPETNVHFIAKYVPTKIKVSTGFRFHNDIQPPVLEISNPHFLAKYKSTPVNILPTINQYYWMEDFPRVEEDNISFVGKFSPAKLTINRTLYLVPDNQDGPIGVQPDTHVSFIARHKPVKPYVWPFLNIFANSPLFIPPEPETNINFLATYKPITIKVNPALRFYNEQIQVVYETNTNFLAKFKPTKVNILRSLFENLAKDIPPISPKYNFYIQLFG